MLILISGVPGTGKTSVTNVLVKKLNAEEIDVKELALKGKFIEGYDEEGKTLIINEKKINNAIKKIIKPRKTYIVDSHLAHFIDPNLAKVCVVLRCNPDVIKKRLKHRGYDENKVAENMMCEYLDMILIEALDAGFKNKLHEIDTTKKNAVTVANEILGILDGNKKKKYGSISWLN